MIMVFRIQKFTRRVNALHATPLRSIVCHPAIVIILLYALIAPAAVATQVKTSVERLEQVAALISANKLVEAEQQLTQILRVAPKEAMALNLFGTLRAK